MVISGFRPLQEEDEEEIVDAEMQVAAVGIERPGSVDLVSREVEVGDVDVVAVDMVFWVDLEFMLSDGLSLSGRPVRLLVLICCLFLPFSSPRHPPVIF